MKVLSKLTLAATVLATHINTVRADLNYYLYLEKEQSGSHKGDSVVVLRSLGSLPLHESTFTTNGDGCPTIVSEAGGINPNFLCAGTGSQGNRQKAFFPVAPGDFRPPGSPLPFRFSAFSQSRGSPSGILVWRNALVVDLDVALGKNNLYDEADGFLDAVSMGLDNSKNNFNSDFLSAKNTEEYKDGDVIAKWYLLTEVGGDPIRDGGAIRVIKGKPPSSPSANDMSESEEIVFDSENEDDYEEAPKIAVSLTAKPAVSLTQAPQQQLCRSITEMVCDDENNDKFGTLCSLLIQVGLDRVFSVADGSYFTLFAPTNDGFLRTFVDKPQPALLSGHELTKLLLSHVVVTGMGTKGGQSLSIGTGRGSGSAEADRQDEGIRYENLVCGAKQEMASDQVTKIGCDEYAEVAYVVGQGNGGSYRPKFLDVDREMCNGIVHTLDYVILPGKKTPQQQLHFHNQNVANIGGRSNDSSASSQSFDSSVTNQLDQSEIMSFFQATVKDFAEEDNEEIFGGISSISGNNDDNNAATTEPEPEQEAEPVVVVVATQEETETKPPATATATTEASSSSSTTTTTSSSSSGGINTQAEGFHSFFGRKGVAADLAAIHAKTAGSGGSQSRARPGNLRHRGRE